MWGWGYSFSMLQMWQCYKSYPSAFCWIFQQRLLDFPTAFSVQKPYLCTEFQRALKQRKQRKTTQETMSLPIFRQRNQSIKAEFNLLLRYQCLPCFSTPK